MSDGRQPSVCSVTFADRDNKSPQQPVYRVDWYRCRLPSLVHGSLNVSIVATGDTQMMGDGRVTSPLGVQ